MLAEVYFRVISALDMQWLAEQYGKDTTGGKK